MPSTHLQVLARACIHGISSKPVKFLWQAQRNSPGRIIYVKKCCNVGNLDKRAKVCTYSIRAAQLPRRENSIATEM